ncbi:peptidoglycan endopeptidase [Romboutsia maritimum]|uniref:Peptidoglycan endopeptidase n=1 Tax=Romboutsia maritimum TaxID=2020948 RepID=A0A371IRK8_9FIRM|nr:C40 family peptidase [Romboutsia maritimum]RDY23111.1 peptidoglycan endopeptidase [Romboutsia maritimum]
MSFMDSRQLVTITLLNALKNTNVNSSTSRVSNNNSINNLDFSKILLNTITGSSNTNCCPIHGTSSNNNYSNLTSNTSNSELDNVLGYINNMKLEDTKKPKEISTSETSTISSTMNKTTKNKITELLNKQLGKDYVWGATGPNNFDCSGLTQYIYKNALNKDIPRVSYEQAKVGKAVDKKDLQVGDLLFFDTMNKGRISHVGMYVGNDEFIHAANPKDGVIKSKLSGYYSTKFKGARRP